VIEGFEKGRKRQGDAAEHEAGDARSRYDAGRPGDEQGQGGMREKRRAFPVA
jgi:hypothetical protein